MLSAVSPTSCSSCRQQLAVGCPPPAVSSLVHLVRATRIWWQEMSLIRCGTRVSAPTGASAFVGGLQCFDLSAGEPDPYEFLSHPGSLVHSGSCGCGRV